MSEQIDEKAYVKISKDSLSAYITFERPVGGEMLTYDRLLAVMEDKQVTFGVDHDKLRALAGSADKEYKKPILIASGEPPEDGTQAKIEFKFNMARDKTPTVLPDGSVDHHAVENAASVHKGDVLAEITKETEGRPGCSVLGFEIKAKPGRPKKLIPGKFTELSEDGSRLVALREGMVEIVGAKIVVTPVQEIRGDVGPETGHITFAGGLNIKGNVLTGYNVFAEGSVHISGCVEASEVHAGGDIVIEQGVKGLTPAKTPGGFLLAGGNITSKFIEGATVSAIGVIRADTILNSTVKSYAGIIVSGRKGNITGGLIYALDEIICEFIGSRSGNKTKLMCGMTEGETGVYKQMDAEIGKLREELKREQNIISEINKQPNPAASQTKRLQAAQHKAMRYQWVINYKSAQKAALGNFANNTDALRIIVRKMAYAPTEVTINRATKLFDSEDVYNSTFRVNKGEIAVTANY